MKKRPLILLTTCSIVVFTLLLAFPMTGAAIGEITPTPDAPDTAPTALPPTSVPTIAPATTVPQSTPVPNNDSSDANQEDVLALIDAALDAIGTEDYDEVLELTSEAIDLDPRSHDAYVLRGVAYVRLDNYDRGIDDMTRAIDIRPFDWTYHVFRGDAYIQAGEPNDALLDYARAITLNPRYAQAYNNQSLVYGALGDEDRANLNNLMVQGLNANATGGFETAISRYTEVINSDAGENFISAGAYYNRGIAYYSINNLIAAIEDYTEAIAIDPEMHDNFLARGIAYRENGELRNAGADFQARIEILERDTITQDITRNSSTEIEMAYGRVYRMSFDGTGGDLITIEARDGTLFTDPLIALLAPDGTVIAGDDDFGGQLDSLIEDFRLPADGTYTLLVSHANGGFEGRMTVTLD
ncbi:MAG: tetratricopeptide repeat protein [Aggregatilineales bacterium]